MKKIFTMIALLGMGYATFAQRLLTEDFNYPAGQLTSAGSGANVSGGNWVSSSGNANYIPVIAGTLSYTGYSTGASATNNNKVSLVATSASAEDAYRQFTTQTSGTIYASFLMNVTDQTRLAENNATGDFFAGFLSSTSTSAYGGGRVYIRKGVGANTFNLGVSANTPTSNTPLVYSNIDLALGTTHLVTIAYTIVAGDINDTAKLFINRPVTLTEPATPDAVSAYASSSTGEVADIARFFLRQGTATQNGEIDGIKVSTNYYDATLPLNLTSFKASLFEKAVQLSWTSTNEQNVKLYAVERSNDSRTFTKIGSVDARNTAQPSYTFADNNPLAGTAYYRLQMVDKDGAVKFSSIVAVNNRKSLAAVVFPNPAVSNISVSHPKADKGATITILNAAGQQAKSFAVQAGAMQTSLPVGDLVHGNYLLVFDNNGERASTKFVKK